MRNGADMQAAALGAQCPRGRRRMPHRRSQVLFQSSVHFVGSLAGSRLAGGRRVALPSHTATQEVDGSPITVRGGRYFIYRPPRAAEGR